MSLVVYISGSFGYSVSSGVYQEVLVTVSLMMYISGSFGYSVSSGVYLRKFW